MFIAKETSVNSLMWALLFAGVAYGQDNRADVPPAQDPGYNAHQETLIYACMGVAALMLALMFLLLWFLVDRSKREVRHIKRILPSVVDKLREKAQAVDDHEDSHGTLRATEFETGFMTSSSVQDNSLEHAPSWSRRQQRKFHPDHVYSTTVSSTRDALGEGSANHAGSSGHVRSDASTVATEASNQIVWREKAITVNVNSRPASHHRGPAQGPAQANQNDARPLVLQTFSPLAAATPTVDGRAPQLASRVEVSALPKSGPARLTSPYAYDNPDMPPGDGTINIHNAASFPHQATGSETKLKYRNSYYESHV